MQILAVANFKGGVGKSTSAESLAVGLAQVGRRTLVVDADPQSSLTAWLGHEVRPGEPTVYQVLMGQVSVADAARSVREGLDLLPATPDLFGASMALAGQFGRERYLAKALGPVAARYEYCLIDCPPGLDLLTANALAAANAAIIPVQCAYPAIQGLKLFMDNLNLLREMANPVLTIAGILLTRYDARTAHAREVVTRLREAFGPLVFETVIPSTVRFDEAPMTGKSILEYAPDSPGALAYRELVQEVLRRVEPESRATTGDRQPVQQPAPGAPAPACEGAACGPEPGASPPPDRGAA